MQLKTASDYEAAFMGSRDVAIGAMHSLQQQLEALKESTDNATNRRQLQLAILALRSICNVSTKPEGKHYTVYCDTVVSVIAKYMNPTVGAKYWTRYLEYLRYIHHILADKKYFKEAFTLCELIADYPKYLLSEDDYKVILGIYLQNLYFQYNYMRTNTSLAQENIVKILYALQELFIRMLQCSQEYNFTYPELITKFVQGLVYKRVSTIFNYLASLPANKTQMYDAFFTLFKEIRTLQPAKEELQAHCQRNLEALAVFFDLDVADKLQQQLGLRHLNACREISIFAHDKSAKYVFTLLYYLVKLVYGLTATGEFKDVYKDLTGKLTTFLERYGDMLMQERWFTDVPIVIALLLKHLQHQANTAFGLFWQHMTSIESFICHLDLISGCIRLAPRITETNLLKLDCCTSARKHTIISLVISALNAYSYFAATVNAENESEELFIKLRTQVHSIMRHGVSVLDSLACITPESAELKSIHASFVQMTIDMRTPMQIQLCITLAEFLLRIRHKFTIPNWTLLLRRLYQMAMKGNDTKLTADLHVAHIASTLQEHEWPDIKLLRNRIGHFHTYSPHVKPGQCILQMALESHSPFKVCLDTKQTYILHWLETQQFIQYHKSNEQLQLTLMECSPSHYSEALVARSVGAGNVSLCVANRLRKLENELDDKYKKTAVQTRLEYLCLAHIKTALLHNALMLQKEKLAVGTKCQEDNLEEMLQRKELASVTIAHEVKLVKQANAALQGFQLFYEKANSEPFISNEISIDWEAIIEDLASLALFLQLAGYTDLATKAWILHYHITNMLNDELNSLRSLAYFCEYSEYFLTTKNEIDLGVETAHKEVFILNALHELPKLEKRFQNYILLYLCQLAFYHARNGALCYAQIYLKLVQQAHSELPNQQGKYNVILGTVDVVRFRILWKHLDDSETQNGELVRRSLLRDMEDTLERFRGDFFILSRSEVMPYTILLLNLIQQIAECSANRLCDPFVSSYFSATFKILLESGSALRLIQMLSMWAWINLQLEYVKKAQIKIKLIEYLLGIQSLEALREISEEVAMEKKLKVPTTYTTMELLHSGMEPLRKMISLHASPIQMAKRSLSPSIRGESSLIKFSRIQCSDLLQQFEILQWYYFMVGCLNARIDFLIEDNENLEDFYEHIQQWLQKQTQHSFLNITFQNIQLLSLQHYVNYLRNQKKYTKASNFLEEALVSCANMRRNVDTVYRINFLLQQRALRIEMMPDKSKESTKRAGLRRALEFNVSPDLNQPQEIGGSVKSSTALSMVPASALIKLPTPGFKIFAGTPVRTPKNTAVPARTTNATSLRKLRKTEKKLVSEIELQHTPAKPTSTIKANSRSLTARKLRQMRAAAATESSSSSSNSTPDANILNQCQQIKSIDLIESDDDKEKENVIPNIKCKANKLNADKANKSEKYETINLLENDELKMDTPEMTVDTTPESKFGKLATPPKTSNAKGTTKKALRTAQGGYKSSATKKPTNMLKCTPPTETTTILPKEPNIHIVEKIKITEDTKSTTTKLKTEVRTLKVISMETETKIISPATQSAKKVKENAGCSSTSRGRPRSTRKAPGSSNDENITPSVTVSRTLSRRAKQ